MKTIFVLMLTCVLFSCMANDSKDTYTLDKSKGRSIIERNNHRLLRVSVLNTSGYTHFNYIYVHSIDCKCKNVSSLDSAIYYMYNNYPNDTYNYKDYKRTKY